MKAAVVRALTGAAVAGGLVLAIAIGRTAQPSRPAAIPAAGCVVQLAPITPAAPTPLVRGQLVAV